MKWSKKVRSGFEATIRKDLDKRGIKYGYETLKLTYVSDYCKHCGEPVATRTYTPDFIIDIGRTIIIEAKGMFSSADRTKMQHIKRCNPTEDIRLLFQRDQRIRRGSKTFYSTWAIKNGFPFAVGNSVPEEWINAALEKN